GERQPSDLPRALRQARRARGGAVFERGERGFQGGARRVAAAAVLVPLVLAGGGLGVGAGGVDRDDGRPGRRVGVLPGVDRPGAEPERIRLRVVARHDDNLRGRGTGPGRPAVHGTGEVMSGEPEPAAGRDKLSGALVGLTFVWLGLVIGLILTS